MWSLIVVLGLVAVVVLVLVLVAMGMRASRAERDDDWISDDETPRGRRTQLGRPRGRRAQTNDGGEPGGDRRVGGRVPMAQQPATSIAEPPRGRSAKEMNDDEFWSTITFDKPKFPWRKDSDSSHSRNRGPDPLAPSAPIHEPSPPPPTPQAPAIVPPPSAPVRPSPLDIPAPRAEVTDPGPSTPGYESETRVYGSSSPAYGTDPGPSTPGYESETGVYGSSSPAYGTDPGSIPAYGSEGSRRFGNDPLNTGERSYGVVPAPSTTPSPQPAVPSPAVPSPAVPSPAAPSAGQTQDADPHRLPSVDELLARIQSDRKRAAAASEAQQYTNLSDPLNDPLGTTGGRSYGSSSSGGWSASDPLSSSDDGGQSSSSGYGSSDSSNDGYGTSGTGYGTTDSNGYGTTDSNGGYGTSGTGYGTTDSGGGFGTNGTNTNGYATNGTTGFGTSGTGFGTSGTGFGSTDSGGGYTSDSTNGYGTSGGSGSGYGSIEHNSGYGTYGSSENTSGYGAATSASGHSPDGFSVPPRQEDPLSGYAGSESYGSFGGSTDATSQPGRYSGYTENSFGESGYSDSRQSGSGGPGGYYTPPNQSHGSTSQPMNEDNATRIYPTGRYGNSHQSGDEERSDDWNSGGDFRR